MTPGLLDIGEVAAHTGLPPSTLRYYEAAGLIESVGRRGLRRLFDANVLGLLDFIALGQRAGFSLDEIGAMVTPDGSMTLDREQLLERADALDQRIRELTAVRDGLRHAADCPAPSHLECPKFLRLLRVAGSRRARARRSGG